MNPQSPNSHYEYYAFISYNQHDTVWGKRLQRKLEHYRMPATLCRERGWKRRPIDPIFFAPTEIQPGALSPELQRRLEASRHLIVICSPHSAQSKWVGEEIRYFHSLGRADRIHLFIVDGTPNSGDPATECFHPVLKELGMPELLGANIHERIYRYPWLNRERAYLQLISKLLDVGFDTLWKRHRRLLIQKIVSWIIGILSVLAALFVTWRMNRPVDIALTLAEAPPHNPALPQFADAVVTLEVDAEIKTDTVAGVDDRVLFRHVPHRFLGKVVRVHVACRDFLPIDTLLTLDESNQLLLKRDPSVYGAVWFLLWDAEASHPAANLRIRIGAFETISDSNGYVALQIPLEQQATAYPLVSEAQLADTLLYMPCSVHSVILAITGK